MNKLIAFVCALFCVLGSYAQLNRVATLVHGDESTVFRGEGALREAYAAAVDGDEINLSGGAFLWDTYSAPSAKAVKFRGTGINSANPTQVGLMYFKGTNTSDIPVVLEGIVLEGIDQSCFKNLQLLDCKIAHIGDGQWETAAPEGANVYIVNCVIDEVWCRVSKHCFLNCYIARYCSSNESMLMNCVLHLTPYFKNAVFKNSIILSDGNNLGSQDEAWNCVGISSGSSTNMFDNCFGENNRVYTNNDFSIFKTFTGTYTDGETFELTDAAVNGTTTQGLIGSDGTQIGMHGGYYPYSYKPRFPQITTMEVDDTNSENGTINVKVQIAQ